MVNRNTSTSVRITSGGEQVDDVLDGLVGFVISGFDLAVRTMGGIGLVVESAVGQRTTEAFVKEQEQKRDVHAFGGEAVGVTAAVAFQQAVSFQFAQIVAELVEPVGAGGKLEGGEYGLVDLFGGPAANGIAAVQQHFQQADDAGVMDFDSGITD